jgi:hypothetical protein
MHRIRDEEWFRTQDTIRGAESTLGAENDDMAGANEVHFFFSPLHIVGNREYEAA